MTSNPSNNDEFGRSVAFSGDTAVAGVHWDDVQGKVDAGSAYVFRVSADPVSYCSAGTSASGCQALLSATGTASATSSSGFLLQAGTVEGSKDGLFFFGSNGQQANPWGNGTSYQCVVPPVVRAPIMTGVGTIGLCDGSFALDLNALWCPSCPKPAKNPGAAAVVQAQLWYRDPASTSNQTTSLSNAIEFVMGRWCCSLRAAPSRPRRARRRARRRFQAWLDTRSGLGQRTRRESIVGRQVLAAMSSSRVLGQELEGALQVVDDSRGHLVAESRPRGGRCEEDRLERA